jgi:hypothetical protein
MVGNADRRGRVPYRVGKIRPWSGFELPVTSTGLAIPHIVAGNISMTSAYDPRRDVLNFRDEEKRGINPARYAATVTPSDTQDLQIYGKLLITNASGSSTENVTVIMASNSTDDTTSVSFPIAPATTLLLPIVVRRVLSTGTGPDIKVVLIARIRFSRTCFRALIKVNEPIWSTDARW